MTSKILLNGKGYSPRDSHNKMENVDLESCENSSEGPARNRIEPSKLEEDDFEFVQTKDLRRKTDTVSLTL